MKLLLYTISSFMLFMGSCAETKHSVKIENLKKSISLQDSKQALYYANTITANELQKLVQEFSSPDFLGRESGEIGQHKAAQYLKSYYINNSIPSPLEGGDYFQSIDKSYFNDVIEKDSENVIAYIEGSEKPDEVVIITAHLDHLGQDKETNTIFYGADDNASGVSTVMEMAQAFRLAQDDGKGPKRSVLFLHTTAEENGMFGSRYYTDNPVFPLENTIANLNLDMIGRVDRPHQDNKNYLYLIGSDKQSAELHYTSEKINNTLFNIDLDYKYNDEDDPNRLFYRSDHYNFAKHNIPVIFYFSGLHQDYHLTSDTADKIDYDLLTKRAQFIFVTAWQLANQENRISNDGDLLH